MVEKRIADSAKVGRPLILERCPGPDAGVDERIVADRDQVLERVEKGPVPGWNELAGGGIIVAVLAAAAVVAGIVIVADSDDNSDSN